MEDFSRRIPDMLESATDRVRSLTVDRVARGLKITALGIVMFLMAILAVIFLLVGLARIVEGLLLHAWGESRWAMDWAMEVAYAIVGALFLLGGGLLWRARATRKPPAEAGA